MGKIEKQVEEMYDMMKDMQDKVSNLEFQFIQLFQVVQSGGGSGESTLRREPVSSGRVEKTAVDIDLSPLESKMDELRAANTDAIIEIREEIKKLTEGKVAKAEEMIKEVSNLLEKGLQLTELGTVLDEIRDKLEELIVELSSQIMQV
ncbi:MAG: hypothetical protein ACFFD4_25985 [Candidatus Odinarchaeota archaeon]